MPSHVVDARPDVHRDVGSPRVAAQIVVLAKQPLPGRVKTRLCPPLTPEQAADVAAAALSDTLSAVRRSSAAHRVLCVDGTLAAPGFTVHGQRAGDLDARIVGAFDDAWTDRPLPTLLIGMDTPQLTPELLDDALERLLRPGTQAVLGLAEDGGWWGLGLHRPAAHLVLGVPTSRADTGALQRRRLLDEGLVLDDLVVLRDVDTAADLLPVAQSAPGSRFAATVATLLTVADLELAAALPAATASVDP